MPTQILTTKLYTPRPLPGLVPRSHLTQRLDQGLHGKLTLVSAPAGFGKTTLITEWLSHSNYTAVWLALDEGDSDPIRFLTYFIAALRKIVPDFGDDVSAMLASSQPPPMDLLLTQLLNDMMTIPQDFVLVLDDYHALDSQQVDSALAFLIDNQPPQMHLVMTTREDPRLPLARLRARRQLTELRAADLRFTSDEAAAFLNQAMGLALSSDDIAALEARTEGWVAGLQLAAISMQGQQDTSAFIESFTGSHHFVLDYLVDEVLRHQPQSIQDFLLRTSILNRMCGPLCDAVLQNDEHSAKDTLETIRQANLFLISLDHERQWYRYHHLFGDLLRKHLVQSNSAEIPALHIRASEWYEQQNLIPEAIHHALTAEDFDRAASMIEQVWVKTHATTFQNRAQRLWMQALPDTVVRRRPVLSAGYGWVMLDFGEIDAADVRLRDAEQWLMPEADTVDMIVIDEGAFQELPATVAAARTYYALALGDIAGTIHHAQRVLALTSESDYHQRGMAASLMGLAYWSRGDLDSAYQSMQDGMSYMYKMQNIHFALSGTYIMADIRLAQGRLRDAVYVYEQALQVVQAQDTIVQGTADLYSGLADLYREQNDLENAKHYLQKSEDLSQQARLPDWRYRFCRIHARLQQSLGDFEGALNLLQEAEQHYHTTPIPDVGPTAARRAHVWIDQGLPEKALAWAQQEGLSAACEVSYLNEFALLIFARAQLAQYRTRGVDDSVHNLGQLLDRMLNHAETGQRQGSVMAILIVQALLQQVQGDIDQAVGTLEQALRLAEPEGYARIFIDEGPSMRALLSDAMARGLMPGYTRRLLAGFLSDASSSQPTTAQPLIDPLSERELEILALVAEGLSNKQISERLYVALSTVKGHNRNIFDKLQVKRRTEAVARARELGLI